MSIKREVEVVGFKEIITHKRGEEVIALETKCVWEDALSEEETINLREIQESGVVKMFRDNIIKSSTHYTCELISAGCLDMVFEILGHKYVVRSFGSEKDSIFVCKNVTTDSTLNDEIIHFNECMSIKGDYTEYGKLFSDMLFIILSKDRKYEVYESSTCNVIGINSSKYDRHMFLYKEIHKVMSKEGGSDTPIHKGYTFEVRHFIDKDHCELKRDIYEVIADTFMEKEGPMLFTNKHSRILLRKNPTDLSLDIIIDSKLTFSLKTWYLSKVQIRELIIKVLSHLEQDSSKSNVLN